MLLGEASKRTTRKQEGKLEEAIQEHTRLIKRGSNLFPFYLIE